MKFDVIVGNPPYGRDKIGSRRLHFKIMKSAVSVCSYRLVFVMPSKCIYDVRMQKERDFLKQSGCERIDILEKDSFKGMQMTEPAVYYCKVGSSCCDKRLKNIYDTLLINDIEKKIFSLFDTEEKIYDRSVIVDREHNEWWWNKYGNKLKKFSHFINFSYTNFKENGEWISQNGLKDIGVLPLDEEMEFLKTTKIPVTAIGFQNKESAVNVLCLLETNLMRFCLWICQDDRNLKRKAYRLFPAIDYTDVKNESDLLKKLGCEEELVEPILGYVNGFDFGKKRKERLL